MNQQDKTKLKLHSCSDLHLEFSNTRPHSATEAADVIVLAGDTWKTDHGIHWARATWPDKEIVYVAGNHEFYGSNRMNVISQLRMAAEETGVHFLDNDEVIINGVRFLGATLWTDFKLFGEAMQLDCMLAGQQCLNDFRVIHEGDRVFSPTDSIYLHNESVKWLMAKRDEKFDGKTVVVTHHAPSFGSVVPRFAKDMLSACFASRLDDLVGSAAFELWIHGHMHDSLDYQINGTRVVCNPRGYCRFEGGEENSDFRPDLIIEV